MVEAQLCKLRGTFQYYFIYDMMSVLFLSVQQVSVPLQRVCMLFVLKPSFSFPISLHHIIFRKEHARTCRCFFCFVFFLPLFFLFSFFFPFFSFFFFFFFLHGPVLRYGLDHWLVLLCSRTPCASISLALP